MASAMSASSDAAAFGAFFLGASCGRMWSNFATKPHVIFAVKIMGAVFAKVTESKQAKAKAEAEAAASLLKTE